MLKLIIAIVFVLALATPVAFAQDTPTPDVATLEATQTPDIVTATAAPTEEATPVVEPTEPAPVEPSPIDESKIPDAMYSVIVVLVVGLVAVAFAGIVAAFRSLPPWARELVLSTAKTGVDEADKVAKGTDTPIDDMAIVELRKLVSRLEMELRATQAQVSQNAAQIANGG